MEKTRFIPCGPTQAESSGWVPPRGGKHTQLAELVGGQLILKLCTEKRAVPSSAIKAGVEEKIERYKKETGQERVGARAKKEFKEEVLLDLLPRAFTKRAHTLLWLAPEHKLLVIDSGTLAAPTASSRPCWPRCWTCRAPVLRWTCSPSTPSCRRRWPWRNGSARARRRTTSPLTATVN